MTGLWALATSKSVPTAFESNICLSTRRLLWSAFLNGLEGLSRVHKLHVVSPLVRTFESNLGVFRK